MIQITKCIEWDMGHRVPNHKNKCRNPHGHRYKLDLTIHGEINSTVGESSEGMIIDFNDIKIVLEETIKKNLDHSFMIYDRDDILCEFMEKNKKENFRFVKVPFVPTVENIACWCYKKLKKQLPTTIEIKNVRVYETPTSWADYCA